MELKELAGIVYDLLLFIGMALVYISESIVKTLIPRRFREKSIKGEIALVTGGAGGLGRLLAMKLANLGAHVIIWDINEAGVKQVVEEIKESGGKCWGYLCDITDKEAVYRTAKAVQIEVGNVNVLVNNAGYVCGRTLLDLPDEEIELTYKVNILSHYWITKAFLKDMMKENHGHIVTVASVAGLLGTYNCTDYSGTKFAAAGYHESLFTELKAHGFDGIHTTLICPYLINTGMFNGVKPRLMPMLEPEYVAERIVSAILTDEIFITIPGIFRFMVPMKFILPAKMCWALMYHIIQGPQAMMMMKRKEDLQKDILDCEVRERKLGDTFAQ